jgi:hypothetical protein
MEFYLPSLLILVISGIIIFMVLPKFAPAVLLTLSLVLLIGGMYHHYNLFKDEYRNATWYDTLKAYAPGIMYGVLIIFLLGYVLSFFGGGGVPVPEVPELPTPNIIESVKNVANNTKNNVAAAANNTVNNIKNNFGSLFKNLGSRNRNGSKVRSSFFEEI